MTRSARSFVKPESVGRALPDQATRPPAVTDPTEQVDDGLGGKWEGCHD